MEQLHQHGDDHHGRNKMRHIGYGLNGLFEFFVLNGIEHKRKENGKGERGQNGVNR